MEKIKKCPFCEGEVEVTNEDNYGYRQYEWYVQCDNCGLLFGFGSGYDRQEVIKKWNKRIG